jgi:hypothetical protein
VHSSSASIETFSPTSIFPGTTRTSGQPKNAFSYTIKKVRDVYLFKFTDALQARLDHLAERKKSDILSAEEEAELAGLLELDRIFTLLNAKIIAES